MKKFIFISVLSLIASVTYGQSFQVPKNYVLVKAEDYKPYEKDIVKCIDWLNTTPPNTETDTRQEAWIFIMKWIEGSPTVMVYVNNKIETLKRNSCSCSKISF